MGTYLDFADHLSDFPLTIPSSTINFLHHGIGSVDQGVTLCTLVASNTNWGFPSGHIGSAGWGLPRSQGTLHTGCRLFKALRAPGNHVGSLSTAYCTAVASIPGWG